MAGVDTPGLRELAGIPWQDPAGDIVDVLPRALAELGLSFYERDSFEGHLAAARVFARQCLAGELAPSRFTAWLHGVFEHGDGQVLDRLLELDDEYELAWSFGATAHYIDQDVLDAARQLIATDHE